MPTDWCERSIFIPYAARREVAEITDRLVEVIAAAVRERLGRIHTLCVGGSLARREPAISLERPHQLVSDIDIVVVLDGCVDSAAVLRAEKEIASEIRDAKVGVVAVPADNLNRVGSFFAADFSAGLRVPIWGPGVCQSAHMRIRRRDRLELIVHQVSSMLLHSGSVDGPHDYLLRPNAGYHEVKLLLECLRALLVESEGGECSYAFVFDQRHEPVSRFVLPARTVESLVRRRELFTGDVSDLPDARIVVSRTLAAIFDIFADTAEVIRYILEGMADHTDLLSVYQITCIALFLRKHLSDRFIAEFVAPALKVLWARTHTDELTREARTAMASLANMPIVDFIERPNVTLNLLRPIRVDYYRLLGDHIFGVRPRADYTDVE